MVEGFEIRRTGTDFVVISREVHHTRKQIERVCEQLPEEILQEMLRHQEHIQHLRDRLQRFQVLQRALLDEVEKRGK